MNDDGISPMNVSEDGARARVPLSVVWVIPLIAVAIALFIAWRAYSERGPVIQVAFETASGLVAGQTELRFRAVRVGLVEEIGFSDDLGAVVAHIRVEKDVAPFVDADALFWLVQPEISARGVSGLDTVLNGVFIEGSWDDEIGDPQSAFTGATEPPLQLAGVEGTLIRLRGEQGGRVQGGAPVLYKGVTVGSIDTPRLADDGSGVTAHAFVRAPYDRLLNTNTRFWGASGFTVSVGAGGLSLDFGNLASLIEGGVEFETVASGGQRAGDNSLFIVYQNRTAAQESLFSAAEARAVTFSTVFESAASGLTVGAPVEWSGLHVGEVTNLGAFLAPSGHTEVLLRVDFALLPVRLGLDADASPSEVREFMRDAVAEGLHARLLNAGLLSTNLKIELVDDHDAPAGALLEDYGAFPIVPALPVDVMDLAASATGLADRLAALPVEEVLDGAVALVDNLNAFLSSPELREAPAEAVALLAEARETVASLETGPLMAEISGTVSDVRAVVSGIGSEANLAQIEALLVRLTSLSQTLETASAGLPQVMASVGELAQTAAALELDALVASATQTAAALERLASAPETQALPADLRATIADARALLGSDALQALPHDVSATLASAQGLIAQVETSDGFAALLSALERMDRIAASVEASAADLPALIASAQAVADAAAALDLDPLVDQASAAVAAVERLAAQEATGLITDARGLLTDPSLTALPAEVTATLASAQGLIDQVETSEGFASLLAALERLDRIAASVEASAADVPALLASAQAVADEAATLDLDPLVVRATAAATAAERLMTSAATQALPGEVTALLRDARTTLADPNLQALPAAIADAAASAQALIATVEQSAGLAAFLAALERSEAIAASVETTAAGLPALRAQLSDVLAKADALPLADTLAAAERALDSAALLMAAPGAEAVPAALTEALDETTATLAALRAGGTVESVTATLASAQDAADAVAVAAADLPALAERLSGLVVEAEALAATYGARSPFNAQTLSMLYDLRTAAQAVTSLSRSIERNPAALIRGR